MAIGSVPAAIGGVWVLDKLEGWAGRDFDELLLTLLAGALLITGAATLVRAFLKSMHERERDTIQMERRHKIAAVALGAAVGFVLGVTSAGSGALIAVGLILLFRLTPTRVVGTDVFHAAILLWAAGLAHVCAGNVDFGLVGNDPDRLDAGRLGRQPLVGAGEPGGAAHDARGGADRRRPRAADQGRAGHAARDHDPVPRRRDRAAGGHDRAGRRASKRRDIQIPSGM